MPIESTPGAYPDYGPLPHRYPTTPTHSDPFGRLLKVPTACGTPTHVKVEASFQDVRRRVTFRNDSSRTRRIGLNAGRILDGQMVRGASIDLAMFAPNSAKVIGRAHLVLRMFEIRVLPGETYSSAWHATVDPGFLSIEDAAKLVTTTETEITDEVSDWVYRGDPEQPVDFKAASLTLPVRFTPNACDIDLDTGQEVFLRSSLEIVSSCVVTLL